MMYTHVQLSMQQDHVIDEIERYGVPLYPEDQATLAYLKAMRLLFERGFLCREHITSPDSAVIGRIKRIVALYKRLIIALHADRVRVCARLSSGIKGADPGTGNLIHQYGVS